MKLHAHEQDRLESLRSYAVLETDDEPAYDALTRVAALICQTPMALISLVDEDRQWFKSAHGVELRETPREVSFCSDAVASGRPLVIGDASRDPRYADNPMVASAGVRAYAGIPLIGRDALPLGTLCVVDLRPRRFTAAQLDALQVVAAQVVALLELRRLDAAAGLLASGQVHDAARIRQALDDGELRAHFQPIVDLRTAMVVGAEALVRWDHPELGLLGPAAFLPAVEASGLMLPVGRRVLELSLDALAGLRADCRIPHPLGMAVNVAGSQLARPGLAATVLEGLVRRDIPPGQLSVEITETSALGDAGCARRELQALRDAGVHLALDDYGVGWSALGRLLELPLSALKLDRSLVTGLPDDVRSVAVTRSTMELARDLGLAVVCEGVETDEQRRALVGLGAVFGQGWLFSRAMPLGELTQHLQEQSVVPRPRAAVA